MEKSVRMSREFFERIRRFLPCTQSTLHEKIGLRKKVCSQKIKRLEKYGFIERRSSTKAGGHTCSGRRNDTITPSHYHMWKS